MCSGTGLLLALICYCCSPERPGTSRAGLAGRALSFFGPADLHILGPVSSPRLEDRRPSSLTSIRKLPKHYVSGLATCNRKSTKIPVCYAPDKCIASPGKSRIVGSRHPCKPYHGMSPRGRRPPRLRTTRNRCGAPSGLRCVCLACMPMFSSFVASTPSVRGLGTPLPWGDCAFLRLQVEWGEPQPRT